MGIWTRWTTSVAACALLGLLAPSVGAEAQTQGGTARAADAGAAAAEKPQDEIATLRGELQSLRDEYASRLAAIESRLAALEGATRSGEGPATPVATAGAPAPAPTAAVPPGAAPEGGPTAALPVYGGGAAASKVFNPDIAAIGDFIGVAGKSPGGGEPSLSMHESELSFQAVVDPYARADFFLTFGPEEVGVEEAFITFPALPGGFLFRAGKMRDAFGKVDAQHNHVLPTIDRPRVSTNLLGGEDGLADAGISVSRLIPNPWLFLEATGQVFRGDSNVFKAEKRGDLSTVGHLRAYQDLSESTNVDLGGSFAYGHNDAGSDSTTRLIGADATLRWRPLRRSIYTHLLARGEIVWSRREQPEATGGAEAAGTGPFGTVSTVGGYAYLEYQFARRFVAGLRYDNSGRAALRGVRDQGGSFILTYWPSEFSQVRAQYRYTDQGDGPAANELLFQLIFAIGAHGAHAF